MAINNLYVNIKNMYTIWKYHTNEVKGVLYDVNFHMDNFNKQN